jgi:ATP-dependent Clp protease ATP-binding subunit ClpX
VDDSRFLWITRAPAHDKQARCSFCGKRRGQVAGLAVLADDTPPGTAICSECLELCEEIITEEFGPAT